MRLAEAERRPPARGKSESRRSCYRNVSFDAMGFRHPWSQRFSGVSFLGFLGFLGCIPGWE